MNLAHVTDDRAARIAAIQKMLADGRRRYNDMERRATYPARPDPDTVALCEHYRLKYPRGRLLKALSYFIDVAAVDLCAVSGLHAAILAMEIRSLEKRTGFSIGLIRLRHNTVVAYRLMREADRDEIRAVIQGSWHFSETIGTQSHGRRAA